MNIRLKITDKLKEDISLLLKQERNAAVKERLTYVSMYTNGITILPQENQTTFSKSLF